jgi:PAS domain S-box-containing protein
MQANEGQTDARQYSDVIAELSALYEIPSLLYACDEAELAEDAIEKATRLFGARYFAILLEEEGGSRVVASWGFRSREAIEQKMEEDEANQYHFSFSDDDHVGRIVLEQKRPVTERQRRLYNVFARRLQNVLNMLKQGEERRRAEEELLRHREHLEELVRERTAELKETNVLLRDEVRERRETAEALRESEERYRTLFEASTDAIFLESVDGQILDCNHTACKMYGYTKDELLQRSVRDLVPGEVARELEDIIKEELATGGMLAETRNKRKNGQVFPIEISARLVELDDEQYVVAFVRDITERRRAEEERLLMNKRLAEAEEREFIERTNRLASMGLLAAGIAHEVNNPLQGMLTHINAVKTRLPEEFDKRESIEMVEHGIETIATLIKQLLALSRDPEPGRARVEFSTALDFVVQLLQPQFRRSKIKIMVKNKPENCTLAMIERDLVQVLLNLFINARDAMPQGGRLTVAAERDEPYCHITLADTGKGIPKRVLGQIFSPFFTTKGASGTGLGLSVTESIIRSYKGKISVESEPGEGSEFHLRIPLAEGGGK